MNPSHSCCFVCALTPLVYPQQQIVQQEEVTQLEQSNTFCCEPEPQGLAGLFFHLQKRIAIGNTINTLDIRFPGLADVHKLPFQTLREALWGLGSRASSAALGYGTTGLERLCLGPSSIHWDSTANQFSYWKADVEANSSVDQTPFVFLEGQRILLS